MSRSERDATRIVRLWLEEGATAIPDHVLDTVLDQLPATPQRRPFRLAWRTPIMNNTIRLISAAAVVVVAALIGYQLLIAPNVGGPGPLPSPSGSASTAPSPTPAPSEGTGDVWPTGSVASGVHNVTLGGVTFSFNVPGPGWTATFSGILSRGGNWISFFYPDDTSVRVFTDPCAGVLGPPIAPAAADLATALTTIVGTDVVGPSDVTVGGLPAKLVVISIRDDVTCSAGEFFLSGLPDGTGLTYANSLDSTFTIWTFDLDGQRFAIWAQQVIPNEELAQEIQQIVDSIQFE